MTTLPSKAKVVIIGGGIHGLSTAWKLSETYKNSGDIIVLEKKDTAAGASGIACGVVRNNYFQPAMRELMAHSVSVWESDPKAFKYNPVGYLQISPEVMHKDVASIYEQQKAIGYESDFIEGAPGVYVDGKKIASIGLRISKGKSYHGISINVDMDLQPFTYINPCGYEGMQVTQIKDFKKDVTIKEVEHLAIKLLEPIF